MGQARKKDTPSSGTAGRLAAGRRPRSSSREAPERAEKKAAKGGKGGLKGKAKKAKAGPFARLLKLVLLLAFMGFMGFAGVLILDVGATLIGGMRFGDITFAHLFDKIGDRVLDRDVPEPKKKASKPSPKPERATPTPTPAAPPPRAPEAAPSPEDYAKHTEPTRDPDVEKAKARLDDLLRF